MRSVLRNLFFTGRLAFVLSGIIILFVISFWSPLIFRFAQFVLFTLLGYSIFEIYVLFNIKEGIRASRRVPAKLSIGDKNEITIEVENKYGLLTENLIFDELPLQFQFRDGFWDAKLDVNERKIIPYFIRPVKRGNYNYGSLVILTSCLLHLFRRRYKVSKGAVAAVYPSFLHFRKYELLAFGNAKRAGQVMVNKKLGHGMEFEQIKGYVQGDPQRWLNWKATARKQSLMVNQYTDELSKDIWCVVDKGRLMRMPFNDMSLLDYAINAALAVSHIAIKSGDYMGLLTFSNKLSTIITPSKRSSQMLMLMNALYAQRTHYMESNYGLMTKYLKTKFRRRSLILLFTNYETITSFRRQLSKLKQLAKDHVLVVFFFQNTELTGLIEAPTNSMNGIYTKAIAEEVSLVKVRIVQELRAAGIIAIQVRPDELSLKAINNYLEIKTRGLI